VRKIVANASLPAKKTWRCIGKAIEFALRAVFVVWEVKNLKVAPKQLIDGIAKLRKNPLGLCRRCRKGLSSPTVLVADAGQMYEAISSTQAVLCLHVVLSLCKWSWVAVSRGKHRNVIPLRNRHAHKIGSLVLSQEDIFQAFYLAMAATKVKCGGQIVQTCGVPTGGMLSKVAASLILGHAENEFVSKRDTRDRMQFNVANIPWENLVCCLRYVDDLIMISHMYCFA